MPSVKGVRMALVHIRRWDVCWQPSKHEQKIFFAARIRSRQLEVAHICPNIIDAIALEIVSSSTHRR